MSDSSKKMDKKQRLLTAAKQVMAERGFANTTVSLVAEEAGVSRGLIHYHFASKEDMLAQVLRNTMEEALHIFQEATAQAHTPEEWSRCVVENYRWMFNEDPAIFRLFLEGVVAAQFSDVVRNEMMSQYDAFGASLTVSIQRVASADEAPMESSTMGVAGLVTVLLDGFGNLLVTAPQVAEQDDAWTNLENGILKLISP